MSTFTTSLARLTRRGWAIAVSLLVVAALAAGCGTEHATVAGHATSSPRPAPVPTVTGGPVVAGQPACAGWPAHALHETLPALFVPVAAERCVTSIATIAGKGQWETATMEKATSDLAPLTAALRHPPVLRSPLQACPDLAMLPPQIVVISASGQELIPLLPLSGCGLVQSAVLAAISELPWQPVSVRLVAPVAAAVAPTGTTREATDSPKTFQNLPDQTGVLPQ